MRTAPTKDLEHLPMKTTIDLLIEARWIIPVEPACTVLENHAVAINQGLIVDVLQQSDAHDRYQPQTIKKLPHHILIPGLINAHTHAAMTLMRGLADDISLMDWLKNHIWPAENKHVNAQFVYDGTPDCLCRNAAWRNHLLQRHVFFPKSGRPGGH